MIRALETILRIALAAVLIYAGGMKAADPSAFTEQLLNYRLVAPSFALMLATILPWTEIVVGVALLARWLYPGALALSIMLMFAFTGVLFAAWLRGLDVACGCFGSGDMTTATGVPMLRNGIILLGFLVLAGFAVTRYSCAREP
jgi:putative oxidoreductase